MVKQALAILLISAASVAAKSVSATCISPMITPSECDFKNEDSHLAFSQPGWSFAKDDKVEELIMQGESFIDNYYASVKTTGDAATRFMIIPTAVSMAKMEIVQAVHIGTILKNDPWSLKDIYTDVLCDIYFEAVELWSKIDRDCPSNTELLVSLQQLNKLDQVRQEINDIITNPNLNMGEQWTNMVDDVELMRDKLNSIDTFGRNIAVDGIRLKYAELYPNFDILLAAPPEDTAQFNARVKRLTDSKRNTILDTMKSTHQNYKNLIDKDMIELKGLEDRSKRAVGQMQAVEIGNMLDAQKTQGFYAITEEIMNSGGIMIQNMADAHGTATRERVVTVRSATPIPFREAARGGSRVFRQ